MFKESIGGELSVKGENLIPVSNGIKASDLIFVSGQLAYDNNGSFVSSTVKNETSMVINNIERILKLADCGLENVIKCTCWLSNKDFFDEFNQEYMIHFSDSPRPARSTVEAGLMFGAKVEIEVIAIVKSSPSKV